MNIEKIKDQIKKDSFFGLNKTKSVCKIVDLYKQKTPKRSIRGYFIGRVYTSKNNFHVFTGAITKKVVFDKICKELGFFSISEEINYSQYKENIELAIVL